MKTPDQIATLAADTYCEFAGDIGKDIQTSSRLRPGCNWDLDGPAVFEELAHINGQTLRGLGNAFNWNLSGLRAAQFIAATRALDADDEFDAVLAAVESAWPAIGNLDCQKYAGAGIAYNLAAATKPR